MEARSKVMLNPQTYSTRESTKCAGQFGGTRCSAWWDGSFHLDGKEEGEVEVEGDGALKTRPSPSAPANYLTGRWAILEIDFARLTYKCTHLCLPPVVLSPWAQLLKGRQRDGRRHTHTHTEGEKKEENTHYQNNLGRRDTIGPWGRHQVKKALNNSTTQYKGVTCARTEVVTNARPCEVFFPFHLVRSRPVEEDAKPIQLQLTYAFRVRQTTTVQPTIKMSSLEFCLTKLKIVVDSYPPTVEIQTYRVFVMPNSGKNRNWGSVRQLIKKRRAV